MRLYISLTSFIVTMGTMGSFSSCANIANALGTDSEGLGMVKDANGNKLGAALSYSSTSINVKGEQGYLFSLDWNGIREDSLHFIANDCTGQAIRNVTLAGNEKTLVFANGKNYIPDNVTNGVALTQASIITGSSWNVSTSSCAGGSNIPGFTLKEVTRSEVGLPDTITGPITVE